MPTVAPRDRVCDSVGEMRCMAVAEGWVMARRKGCMPFVIDVKAWVQLRDQNSKAASDEEPV